MTYAGGEKLRMVQEMKEMAGDLGLTCATRQRGPAAPGCTSVISGVKWLLRQPRRR